MQFSKLFLVVGFTVGLVYLACAARTVSGQSVASGTIEGSVVDPTGAVVVGASVEIRNPLTGFVQTAVTDGMGLFRFTNIPFTALKPIIDCGIDYVAAQLDRSDDRFFVRFIRVGIPLTQISS